MTHLQIFDIVTTQRARMKRSAFAIVALLLCMSLPPTLAQIPTSNDNTTNAGEPLTLSIDGTVLTKFVSVGADVQIQALTRGHSENTIVTANIIHYPNMDAIDLIASVSLPEGGNYVDMVVLSQVGAHDDDADTMAWEAVYTIPVNAVGGVYGASITAEDGNLRVTDDPTQLAEVFREQIELVLAAVDNAWDRANPTLDIKGEFDELDIAAEDNGGWGVFVTTSRDEPGIGGSEQLWDAMIDAGHNQYNMSAGANFLEAWMDLLGSEDQAALSAMIGGLMVYLDEFPLPRTLDDFDEMVEYMLLFDPIENFTRFEGTGDFQAAYDALLDADEFSAMRDALDDLANGTKKFESAQILMQNLALLAVSIHPEAIAEAVEAWVGPLMEGEFETMTPIQKYVVRWIEMASELNEDTDIQDTDGDEIPDRITFQYEYLLETTEGQSWTAKMESNSPWVNDIMDDFNMLPEDILAHVIESVDDPIWGGVSDTMAAFGEFMDNSTGIERHMWWPSDEGDDEEGEPQPTPSGVHFEELYDIRTSIYDKHVLDLGLELKFWGPQESDYPPNFVMTMTNDRGDVVSATLAQDDDETQRYLGRLTATQIEDTTWTFSQPMADFDATDVSNAEFRMESLRDSMMDVMIPEGLDETFLVSSIGVLVEQDESVTIDSSYTVDTMTYDHEGAVEGAEVDIAILRISPQQAEGAFAQFEPEGEVELTISSDQITGRYDGSDLDGDLSATIYEFEGDEERMPHPQRAELEDEIEVTGMGTYWGETDLPSGGGLANVMTSGTTDTGLEFEFHQQVPLPETSGCGALRGHSGGSIIYIDWYYSPFVMYNDEGQVHYDKPDLLTMTIDWGDGTTPEEYSDNANQESGWVDYDYSETDPMWAVNDYDITITYTDVNGGGVSHYLNYKPNEGFERDGERDGYVESGWCDLDSWTEAMPSAQIIDGFITDGPGEVMDEQILPSNADGEASLVANPSMAGIYVSIVQSKVVHADGETMTGIGMSFSIATNGLVSVDGPTLETTIAGFDVLSITPGPSGLADITIVPTGVDTEAYVAKMMIAPLDLTVPFPDFDYEEVESEYELDFQSGDTQRTQEVRITAPVSLLAISVESEDSNFPEALYAAVLLANPGGLEMTGALGPGQTTNIALDAETGEANRILAMAAPKLGFDPASIDFSAFTELIWQEGARNEMSWMDAELSVEEFCIGMRVEEQNWGGEHNVAITLRHSQNEWASMQHDFNPSGAILTDGEGNTEAEIEDWAEQEWEDDSWGALYDLDLTSEDTFTLILGDFEWIFDVYHDEEENHYYIDYDDGDDDDGDKICSMDVGQTDAEEFAMFDEFFSSLDSVAWGLGSSADLRLPILSSPRDEYTVIAVAQLGEGSGATAVAALGAQVAVPNPEPPVMQNLTLSFGPANPLPGDVVQITALDENYQPVPDLSVTLMRDNVTMYGLISNEHGQAHFGVTVGTIVVRVSGGMFHPSELTIIVTEEGIETEDGEELPADSDGDGVLDEEDEFPDDPDEVADTDGDGVGDNEDVFPLDANESADSDGDGIGDNAELGSDSSDDKSNSMLIIAAVIVTVLLMAAAILLVLRRRSAADEGIWDDQLVEDELFDAPTQASAGPTRAPPMIQATRGPAPETVGTMNDGYETIEHPVGSGEWWWKDPATGQWNEWS